MTSTQKPSHIRPRPVVYALMVLLFVIWSNSFHAIGYFRRELAVGATDLVALRYGPVVPFCLVYCLLRWSRLRTLMVAHGWRVLVAGLLAVPGYNLPLNWGQLRVPPATASLLIATNPVFTYLLALVFLGERMRAAKILGLALSFLGVYGLLTVQHGHFGDTYIVCALVVLLAPLSWALATVVGKPVTASHDPLLFTFAATGIGSLPYMIALLAGTGETHAVLASMPQLGWIALIHLTVGCTIVGFAIWFWALKHLAASSVAAFVFLNPPLTLLFGIIWGTETFHWSLILFGLVILGGVALSAGVLRPTRSRPAA